MITAKWNRAFLAALLLITTSACVANRMHRPVSVQMEEGYSLAFIEFDDQGELWDPVQLSRAISLIERANRSDRGCSVFTFIHGWQHNASHREENDGGAVYEFKRFLQSISRVLARDVETAQPLVGIYLGWRGKSGSVPGLNLATFYSRAGAARRIAGTSATEVIYRILSTTKKQPKSGAVLMGHSLGGQILERAVTQALVGELLNEDADLDRGLLADLVVLINPAARSIHAKQFVEMLDRSRIALYRTDDQGTRHPVPLMVSITSSADLVTRWAFQGGTWFSALRKNFREYPDDACLQFEGQRSFYIRTPGHNDALVSHEVTAAPLAAGESPLDLRELGAEPIETEFDPIAGRQVFSFNGSTHRFTVRSLAGAVNDTPYWIMRVPRQLIPGHSGFFTEDTSRLIGSIIAMSGALEEGAMTEVVRKSGVRPANLAITPEGQVLVSDISRRVWKFDTSSNPPLFYGCLPRIADPVSTIGFDMRGTAGFGVLNRLSSKARRRGQREYETLVLPFDIDPGTPAKGASIQLHTTKRYTAAAFDLDRKKIFLAGEDGKTIDVADLMGHKPQPEPWFEFEAKGVISALHFASDTRSLFVAGGTEGAVYRLAEGEAGPSAELLAENLGWPVGMAVDDRRGRLFVGDAKGRQIWRIDCPAAGTCTQPRSLGATEILVSPDDIAVAPDGSVWIADLEGGAILALSPEGELIQEIRELPME